MIIYLDKPDTELMMCRQTVSLYLEVPLEGTEIVLPRGRTCQIQFNANRSWKFPDLKADIGILCWPGYIQPSIHIIGWTTKPCETSAQYRRMPDLKELVDRHKNNL